jgi:hypothetical protein
VVIDVIGVVGEVRVVDVEDFAGFPTAAFCDVPHAASVSVTADNEMINLVTLERLVTRGTLRQIESLRAPDRRVGGALLQSAQRQVLALASARPRSFPKSQIL